MVINCAQDSRHGFGNCLKNYCINPHVGYYIIYIKFPIILSLSLLFDTDYPALWAYTRDIYQTGAVRTVIDLEQAMKGYFVSWCYFPAVKVMVTVWDFLLVRNLYMFL